MGPSLGPLQEKVVGPNGIVNRPGGGREKGDVPCDWGPARRDTWRGKSCAVQSEIIIIETQKENAFTIPKKKKDCKESALEIRNSATVVFFPKPKEK